MKKIHNDLNIEVTSQINNFSLGIPLKHLVSKDLQLLCYIFCKKRDFIIRNSITSNFKR